MKAKGLAILFAVAMLFTLYACRSQSPIPKSKDDGRYALLSGYPEDIMPLYQNQKVLYCSFEQTEQPNPIFGRCVFTVRFASKAPKADAVAYYKGKFTNLDNAGATDLLAGKAGDNRATVALIDNAGETDVTITLGLTEAQIPPANPYFASYPDTIKPLGDKNTLSSRLFERYDQSARSDMYTVRYSTTMSETEFVGLYEKTYRNSAGFDISVYASGRTYSLRDGSAIWSIVYTKPQDNNTAILTLSCLIERK